MPRAHAMAPIEAIRIEDEVWQEAFARREPARPARERRLRSVDREYEDWLLEATGESSAEATNWSVPAWVDSTASAAAVDYVPSATALAAEQISDAEPTAFAGTATEAAPLSDVDPALSSEPLSGEATVAVPAAPERRTIKIQGRGAERNMPWPDPARRPTRRPYERTGFRPDRVAMWAVLLGFVLVLVAIVSAH